MRLIITEYMNREAHSTTEFPERETFQEVTHDLVFDLRALSATEYMTDVLTKWFGGRYFGDSSPGSEKSFNIRQYDGTPGEWVDFLFRV